MINKIFDKIMDKFEDKINGDNINSDNKIDSDYPDNVKITDDKIGAKKIYVDQI